MSMKGPKIKCRIPLQGSVFHIASSVRAVISGRVWEARSCHRTIIFPDSQSLNILRPTLLIHDRAICLGRSSVAQGPGGLAEVQSPGAAACPAEQPRAGRASGESHRQFCSVTASSAEVTESCLV